MVTPVASGFRLKERSHAFQRAGLAVALYAILFSIRALPYYNWYYTWALILLFWAAVLASPILVAFILPPARSALQWAANALLYIAVFLFISGVYLVTSPLRGVITQSIIEARYCNLTEPLPGGTILGGLHEIETDDSVQPRSGAFVDESGCMGPSCVEIFYYCPNAIGHIVR